MSRNKYLEWSIEVFHYHLHREISTQKWYYYREWKRANKLLKRGRQEIDQGQNSEEEDSEEEGVAMEED